jgi:hypothetical protein
LRDAQLVRLVDGKTVAQVSAAELRYQRQGGEFHAGQVHARLLPGPQARALESFGAVEVVAPEVDGDRNQTRAVGQVSVSAARGDQASGADVLWDGERRLLSSEKPVLIAGNGYTLSGGSLEATTDGERFELGHGARGTVSHAPVLAKGGAR